MIYIIVFFCVLVWFVVPLFIYTIIGLSDAVKLDQIQMTVLVPTLQHNHLFHQMDHCAQLKEKLIVGYLQEM